jgi:TonB-linked SusC/RagA family outer membrane protein
MQSSLRLIALIFAFLFAVNISTVQAQDLQPTLKGKVTDENDKPLEGVTVNIKGQNLSTVTNAAGNYSLRISNKKAIIVFTFVGLEKQEIPIGNSTTLNVKLLPNSTSMQGVVVTALNIKRNAKSLGYSIATLDGSEINKVQSPNLINALSGKVAGVDVGNIANGVAGSKRIVIRGGSSLTGNNQPLWVIDGIPINSNSLGGLANNTPEGGIDYGDGLTGINPDDIESISVLKGNAAAALYGSRASNGVILVTTKSGKSAKGKVKVDVSSSLLVDRLIDLSDFQYQYGQSAVHNSFELPISGEDAFTSDSWGHKLDGTPAPQFDGVVRPFSAHKDNYKRFFNLGSTITNTVALSGSSESSDYRVSVSDLRNTDIVPNAKFTRTSVNSKLHSKFGKLDADIVVDYSYQKANNRPFIGGNHSNQFYSLLYLPTNIDQETLKPGHTADGREFQYAASISNPYYVVNKNKETDSRNNLRGSIILKYQFTDWFYARGRLTRDYYLSKRLQYIPDNNLSSSYPGGSLDQRLIESNENNYEFLLGVDPNPIGKFSINAFVGGNINWRASTQSITSGNTFVVPGVYTFNNLANKLPQTIDSKQKTNSLFGSIEFSYSKYLYLTLTGRNDWFSTLPLNNNNLFYPSAALSFVFSDLIEMPSWVSFGKLRASSAQVSGDTGPYQLDLSYALDPLQYGSTPLQTIGTNNIPNKDLKPLLSSDYEVGLEMDFLGGRLGFDVDYYKKNIKDDIVVTSVSNTTGFATAILNVGKLSDHGLEALVRAIPVKTGNFKWDITATFSSNTNKVISLGSGTKGANILLARSKSGNASIQLEEGENYGGIYGYTYRRDSLGNKIFNAQGLPLYNATQTRLRNSLYDKMFGFSNNFTWKNISLYIFLDAKFGAYIYSETNATAYDNGKHKATLIGREEGLIGVGINDVDKKPNTVLIRGINSPAGPGATLNSYYQQIKQITEEFVYDASFVKLREVALSYNFPKTMLNKINISNASVSLVARNLLTLYKNKNLMNVDPESQVASNNQQGIERMTYPTTRNYGVTLKFGF